MLLTSYNADVIFETGEEVGRSDKPLEFTRLERLQEFMRRLAQAPAVATLEEAYALLCDTLNQVENELSDIPFAPEHWATDGRLYPPEMDNIRVVPGFPNVMRFRNREHNTFISLNGAIEIQSVKDEAVVFKKPGSDGQGVWK